MEGFEEYDDVPEFVDCDYTLLCRGDSMINARIFDGDIVCVKQQSDVGDRQIAVVCIDGEATLKRVYKEPGKVTLKAENPTYKTMYLDGEELETVRIVGRAVWFISSVR